MTAVSPDRMTVLHGVGWMLGSGLCFVGVTGIVRYLGTDLPAAQGAFLRFAFGIVFLLPSLLALQREGVPPGAWPLFGMRGVVHAGAVICWFYAMARLPVAEVTAIGYLNPVLVTVGGALIFGEALARRRIITVLVALAGAVIVLRPGLREVTDGHLAQLAAACFFAGSYLFARSLSRMVPAGAVVGLLSVLVTVVLAPFAWAVWVPVTLVQCGWLALVAGFATAAHYCMTRAFAAAPLAVTQPVVFLQLVWATLLGAVVFDEGVDPYVILGGAVIIGAVSWLTWREVGREAVAPGAGAARGGVTDG
jgi:drug/metabolite transporter (DMT)-like permease